MSVRVMHHIWESGLYANGTLLVLLALGDWADDDGYCWPSVPKLARKTRMSERNVQLALRQLEAEGAVARTVRPGRNHTNSYLINLKIFHLSENGENSSPLKGEKSGTEKVKNPTGKGEKIDGEKVKNPTPMDTSEEPSPEPSRQQQAGSGIAAAAENETHASQFSWVEVRQYVDVTKPHAKNPGGLARKLYRTGEEDEDIKHFFLLRAAAKGKQQKQSHSFSEFDFNTYIEELITNNDVAQLERERDGIEQREGPKLDWERRVFDFFSQTAADHDEAA